MADVKKALLKLMSLESGYVNDPTDTGGETYCGISRKNWPKWEGWPLVDKHKPLSKGATINDAALQETVDRFYKVNFWDKIKGDYIVSQEVAEDLLSRTVVNGIAPAVSITQDSLGLPATGIFDYATLTELNKQNPYA